MIKSKLFFATNRRHEGDDRWNPTGYGKKFSNDGHENLRFGDLDVKYDAEKVKEFVAQKDKKDKSRVGDGVGLSDYLSGQAKQAEIRTYEDLTNHPKTEDFIAFEENSSTKFFRDLKKEMMEDKDVMIYIHGYNVHWHEAVGGAMALEIMLNSKRGPKDKEVIVVLFSWPSNGSQMPYAAYISDRSDAKNSAEAFGRAFLKLRDFLLTISKAAAKGEEVLCESNIHLLCHSMGNFLLQKALVSKILGYTTEKSLPRIFKQIFLCAPDVDDEAFEDEGLDKLHKMAENVTVYYNKGDLGMNFAKYTKHFEDRLGQVGISRPNHVHVKVHQVDCSPIVTGFTEHSYYLWATVNQDIQQSIAGVDFDHENRMRKPNTSSRGWIMV